MQMYGYHNERPSGEFSPRDNEALNPVNGFDIEGKGPAVDQRAASQQRCAVSQFHVSQIKVRVQPVVSMRIAGGIGKKCHMVEVAAPGTGRIGLLKRNHIRCLPFQTVSNSGEVGLDDPTRSAKLAEWIR